MRLHNFTWAQCRLRPKSGTLGIPDKENGEKYGFSQHYCLTVCFRRYCETITLLTREFRNFMKQFLLNILCEYLVTGCMPKTTLNRTANKIGKLKPGTIIFVVAGLCEAIWDSCKQLLFTTDFSFETSGFPPRDESSVFFLMGCLVLMFSATLGL